jgi:hypothetical protein
MHTQHLNIEFDDRQVPNGGPVIDLMQEKVKVWFTLGNSMLPERASIFFALSCFEFEPREFAE